MNPTFSEAYERPRATRRCKVHEGSSLPGDDDVSHRQPLWIPEDIAEPEPWTIASFNDLLPHEPA